MLRLYLFFVLISSIKSQFSTNSEPCDVKGILCSNEGAYDDCNEFFNPKNLNCRLKAPQRMEKMCNKYKDQNWGTDTETKEIIQTNCNFLNGAKKNAIKEQEKEKKVCENKYKQCIGDGLPAICEEVTNNCFGLSNVKLKLLCKSTKYNQFDSEKKTIFESFCKDYRKARLEDYPYQKGKTHWIQFIDGDAA